MSKIHSSFDPETDKPTSPRKGTIKSHYDKLLDRGEDETAEKLREADSTTVQHQICDKVPDFDPAYDSPNSTGEMRVRDGYQDLIDDGRDEKAETLRALTSVRRQRTFLTRLRKVDEKIEELEADGRDDDLEELRSKDSVAKQRRYAKDLDRHREWDVGR